MLGSGQLAEQGLPGQLLTLEPPDITELIVTEAQKALEITALEVLQAGLQVDREALAAIGVIEPLGHIDLDAADGVSHATDGPQIDEHMVGDRSTQLVGELPLEQVDTTDGIEGIDLVGAIALGFDVGIPRHLGDAGGAAIDPQAGDHVGVAASHIGADQQDVLIGDAAPGRKRVGDRHVLATVVPAKQIGDGHRQQQTAAEPDGHRAQHLGHTPTGARPPRGLGQRAALRRRTFHSGNAIAEACSGSSRWLKAAAAHRAAGPPARARGWRRRHHGP